MMFFQLFGKHRQSAGLFALLERLELMDQEASCKGWGSG